MADPKALEEFTEIVFKNLQKNGFPAKSVAFPLEKMYESANQRGFSFNKVRDNLKAQGIHSEIEGDRIIFSQESLKNEDEGEGFNMAKMAKVAREMMDKMSPEQRSQINDMIKNMSPSEMAEIQKQWESMPAEDKMKAMREMRDRNA